MADLANPRTQVFQFGPFELDVRAGELRRSGIRIKLREQPVQILLLLLEHPGEVVLRDEIRLRLWPNNTIVEFDHGINAAIQKLRDALGESAGKPRYVETVARRGYRFIAEVKKGGEAVEPEDSGQNEADDPTALSGQTISHFRILEKIGSGGMGVVYRAEDVELQRYVALKVLPYPISELPESMIRRFEREARAASALNHPNICTIHGFEKLQGQPVIVMELVDGETLEQRLRKGALPLDQSVAFAVQIAAALAEAHRKGVVHRDLKPANIMLTKSGAKVLDFGLARVDGATAHPQDPQTNGAALQGTLHYMSPEQVRGQQVDARTDIFSFGVVLSELLTGKRPFDGQTSAAITAAILDSDPPALAPVALNRIVRRCLAKDTDERWQSALDLKIELEWLAEAPGKRQLPAAATWRTRYAWIGLVVFASLSIALVAASLLRRQPNEAPLARFNISPPEGTLFGGHPFPVVSPDGRRIVFITAWKKYYQLWLRSIDSPLAVPLTGPEGTFIGDSAPFWSPDSKSIAFFTDNKLQRIDFDGPTGPSEPTTLCATPFKTAGGTWSRNGVIIFSFNGLLHRIPDTGGSPIAITRRNEAEPNGSNLFPSFLPDGRHFLFAAEVSPSPSYHFAIRVGSLDSEENKPVLEADSNALFAQGRILYVRDQVLMAQPFDARRLVGAGDPAPVAAHVAVLDGWSSFSASQNGLLVYHTGAEAPPFDLIWFDRAGNKLSTLGTAGTPNYHEDIYYPLQLSPDRKTLALVASEQNSPGIWLYDVPRGVRTRFTFDPDKPTAPAWSPDGRSIAFASRRMKHFDIYRKAADQNGEAQLIYTDGDNKYPTSWSPDGKFLLFDRRSDSTNRSSIWILPLTDQSGHQISPFPLGQSPVEEGYGQFSPDGRWIAFESWESARPEVYLAPFRGSRQAGGRRQVSTAGGSWPRWRADGKEIFYRAGFGRNLVAVPVKFSANDVEIGAEQPIIGSLSILGFDVSADGQRFLVRVRSRQTASEPLTVVQNWTAALKK